MKILLVNPDTGGRDRAMLPIPPLALASLAAVAGHRGHDVAIWDAFAHREPPDRLARRLVEARADVVGLSVLTPADPATRAIVRGYRDLGGRGTVVLGGVHATVFHDRLVAEGVADVVVRREGEGPFAELLDALAAGRPLDTVRGLTFRRDGATVATPDSGQIKDLETIPFPAWEAIAGGIDVYGEAPTLGLFGRTLPVLGTRGCPRRCTFCGQEIFHEGVRTRSPVHIVAEVRMLVERFDLRNFVFLDANFPVSEEAGRAFCEAMQDSGLARRVRWSAETKVDLVDRALLRRMAEAGCRNVEFGFEVGSGRVLAETGKGTRLEQALEAMRGAREAGIHVFGLFMIGLPGETTRDILRTFRLARRLDCDMVKFNITVPYPGTRLFEDHRAELLSRFDPETYNAWFRSPDPRRTVTVVPGGLSAHRLILLQRLLMLAYYARPRVLVRHLRRGTLRPRDFARGARFLLGGLALGAWKAIWGWASTSRTSSS